MEFRDYLLEIEKNIKKLTGFNIFLSSKDIFLVKSWYDKNIPLDYVLKVIHHQIKNIPKTKRKFFSLKKVNLELSKLDKKKVISKPKDKSISDDIKSIVDVLKKYGVDFDVSDIKDKERLKALAEKKLISHLWKRLSIVERERITKEALLELKQNYNINLIDKEKVLKKIIAKKIKKHYGLSI